MRRIKSVGVALLAMLAMSTLGVGVASASPKVLEIKEEGLLKNTGTEVYEEGGFELKTTTGNFICESGASETLTTNDSKTDTFKLISAGYYCYGPFEFGGPGGVSTITASAKGKATASVTVFVPWPAPNEKCVYTGKTSKDNEVKASNTVSGLLFFSISTPVKLKGQGCPQKKAELTWNSYTYGPSSELEAALH